jgi:hypothetical protein
MNPSTPQFNEGVKPIPGGSQPTTPSSARVPYPDYYKVMTPPLPINASTGGAADSKYALGERGAGKGEASELMKPVPRPKANQGTTTFKPGTGPVTIGGEKPSAIPVTGPKAPKAPRLRGGFGGILGGGGAFGKIK